MVAIPRAPHGLEERGKKLWRSCLVADPDMGDAMREVLLEACRCADRLDRLDEIGRSSDAMMTSKRGELIANPAFAEARQQANLLKMLVATLRLPESDSGKRPQFRGTRGVNQPHLPANVRSLDRFRAAASG